MDFDTLNNNLLSNGWTAKKEFYNVETDFLSEDLAQFVSGVFTLDFGFYGNTQNQQEGEFVVYLIKSNDWENPVAKFSSPDLKLIHKYLEFLCQQNWLFCI